MAKKKSVPARQHIPVKRENKFIDMPKEKLIKVCVIAGVAILAIVLFFVLRSALDGHLEVKDGVVVTEGDNWIVTNTSRENQNARYFKLGSAGDVEGYTRVKDQETVADANTPTYAYTPSDEAGEIYTVYVRAASGEYDAIASQLHTNYPMYFPDMQIGELVESEVNGVPARSFTYMYNYDSTPQTEQEGETPQVVTNYTRGYNLYLKAGHGHSISVAASASGEDEAALPTVEKLEEEAKKVAAQIQIG